MPKAPTGKGDTRTFRRGTRIPGSDLVLTASIRTRAHKLPDGYGIDAPSLGEWAWGQSWDEAIKDFLTGLRDTLAIISRNEHSNLEASELAKLRRLRAWLAREPSDR